MESDHLSDMDEDTVTGTNFLDGGNYDLEMDEMVVLAVNI